jgi:hypothetical protein
MNMKKYKVVLNASPDEFIYADNVVLSDNCTLMLVKGDDEVVAVFAPGSWSHYVVEGS